MRGVAEKDLGTFHHSLGDDHLHIRRRHRFGGPMVNGQPADHASGNLKAFQRLDEQRNIAAAARCLPAVKLTQGHGRNLITKNPPAKRSFHAAVF